MEVLPRGRGRHVLVLGKSIRTWILSWVLVVKRVEGYLGSEPPLETLLWEDANPNLRMPMFSP